MSSHPALTRSASRPLSIDLAQSRVGLAAVKCKLEQSPESCQLDDVDVRQAEILRAYYELRLKELAGDHANDGATSADPFHLALRAVVEKYRSSTPRLPESDRQLIERLVSLLDRLVSRSLTRDDAAAIVDILNTLTT